jgi:hypothetical protein
LALPRYGNLEILPVEESREGVIKGIPPRLAAGSRSAGRCSKQRHDDENEDDDEPHEPKENAGPHPPTQGTQEIQNPNLNDAPQPIEEYLHDVSGRCGRDPRILSACPPDN